ncbi:endonuclease/exonuclease/phosphatase [Arthrobacter sp. PGP41]|uniref:endonuclease/exonuclease/phosphatase family protein n=1 Tax=unclassified Arthrobacter TaxID=235627 RepID=UPI000CDC8C14|nr:MULTISPECIES: endonuclease/exonuclease/phosphatase family protein [unclassified Arthrobacter]AUZ36324.1 endonuclease/exonuclease/phosphatase [Arthrobacter sp. PGP41]MDT0196433.1 endonuclease/exonuclease/phosphatase family protein [Arthrobacter sp. AB6]
MKRKLAATLSAAALAVAGVLSAGAPAIAAEEEEVKTTGLSDLRVMSYNIHHGASGDDVLDLDRIAREIESTGAQIVGLQEVDRHWSARSNYQDQAAWLAERLDMHYAYAANLDLDPEPGRTDRRQYGTAVLSKYPILSSQNHLLTNIQYAEKPTEQRGLLETVINVEGNHIGFYNTHLDHRRSEQRQLQVKEILGITSESDRPSLLVGDLNAVPASTEMQQLMTRFTDVFAALGQDQAYTMPVENPDRRIDYILGHGDIRPRSAEVISSAASDHLPIVADVSVARKPNGLVR